MKVVFRVKHDVSTGSWSGLAEDTSSFLIKLTNHCPCI